MSTLSAGQKGATTQGGPPGRAALTLVELLVVVVLVGLAASMVTLRLHGSTDRARLRAATVRIEQALRLARHRATTRQQAAWLVFQLDSGRFRLVLGKHERGGSAVGHALDGVSIERGSIRGSGITPTEQEEFTIRITPTGASLPWALELWTEGARRVIWSDGVSGRLAFVDNIGLHELRWEDLSGDAP